MKYDSDIAIKENGDAFSDKGKGGVHEGLLKIGKKRIKNTEWFECNVDDVKNVMLSIKNEKSLKKTVTQKFKMRPEQKEAVRVTSNHFKSKISNKDKAPHFLWNAKMRFGKTFTTYQLANEMNWDRIMIYLQPAVENERFVRKHIDFQDGNSLDVVMILIN